MSETDYIKFLCGQGYKTKHLRAITGDKSTCSKTKQAWDLNIPSFTLSTKVGITTSTRMFHRTVTNVGSSSSIYKAIVKNQDGIKIKVVPNALSFKAYGEKRSFVVKVTAKLLGDEKKNMSFGSLVWDDGVHQVRSPVVAFVKASLPRSS